MPLLVIKAINLLIKSVKEKGMNDVLIKMEFIIRAERKRLQFFWDDGERDGLKFFRGARWAGDVSIVGGEREKASMRRFRRIFMTTQHNNIYS